MSYGKTFSPEFLDQQTKDKSGALNPMFGQVKSMETLAKLYKLIHVYDAETLTLLGSYPTVVCKKTYNIGYDTLSRCLNTGEIYKGRIFTRLPLTT